MVSGTFMIERNGPADTITVIIDGEEFTIDVPKEAKSKLPVNLDASVRYTVILPPQGKPRIACVERMQYHKVWEEKIWR